MKNRDIAIQVIDEFIKVTYVKKNRDRIFKQLKDRINMSKLTQIFNSNFYLNTLTDDEIYFILNELNKINKEDFEGSVAPKRLDAKQYYTEIEIENIANKPIAKHEIGNTFTFNNVLETVGGKQYICAKMTAQEFKKFYDMGILEYDFNQQRDARIRKLAGEDVKQANINMKSVNSIVKAMESGQYVPTPISINITKGTKHSGDYLYDEESHTLTVSEDNLLALNDGGHRVTAILQLLNKHPNTNLVLQINLFHMSIEESQAYIYQQAQQNRIDKKVLDSYKQDVYTTIANNISSFGNMYKNVMYGKVATDDGDVLSGNALITRGYLANIIRDSFKVNENKIVEIEDLTEYLISVFNRLYGSFDSATTKINESRKNELVCYPNTFYIYIMIAAELQDDDNWKKKVDRIVESISWGRGGELNKFGLDSLNKELVPRQKTELRKLVKEMFEHV